MKKTNLIALSIFLLSLTGCAIDINREAGSPDIQTTQEKTTVNADGLGNVWEQRQGWPFPVFSNALAAVNGKLYSIGGLSDISGSSTSLVITTITEIDPILYTCTTKATLPVGFSSPRLAVLNNKIYIFNGAYLTSGGWGINTSIYEYDPAANTVKTLGSLPNNGMYVYGVAEYNGKIYVGGIYNDPYSLAKEIFTYQPVDNSWAKITDVPSPRTSISFQALDGKLYYAGGTIYTRFSTAPIYTDVDVYDLSDGTWSKAAPMNNPRMSFTFLKNAGKLVAISDTRYGNDLFLNMDEYDPVLNTWTVVGTVPNDHQKGGVGIVNDRMYFAGGYIASADLQTVYYSTTITSVAVTKEDKPFELTIEAESFNSTGGTLTNVNENSVGVVKVYSVEGCAAGYIDTGDWADFSAMITRSGLYQVEYRYSSPTGSKGIVIGSGNSGDLAFTTLPSTGGWENWVTISAPNLIPLTAGQQFIWIAAGGNNFNLNWIKLTFVKP